MARRLNPQDLREGYRRRKADLLKHGDKGHEAFRRITDAHEPDVIFKLPSGPDREARVADLFSAMSESTREIMESGARSKRKVSKPVARKKKSNPQKNPLFRGESEAIKRAQKSMREWLHLHPFETPEDLMKGYDALHNARYNFLLGGDKRAAEATDRDIKNMRRDFVALIRKCRRIAHDAEKVTKNPSNNPTKAQHLKIGMKHLKQSEKDWSSYLKNKSCNKLVETFRNLEIAHSNLSQAKDAEGVKQAKQGIKVVRSELMERLD